MPKKASAPSSDPPRRSARLAAAAAAPANHGGDEKEPQHPQPPPPTTNIAILRGMLKDGLDPRHPFYRNSRTITNDEHDQYYYHLLDLARNVPVDSLYEVDPNGKQPHSILYHMIEQFRTSEHPEAFLRWFDGKGLDPNRPVIVNGKPISLLQAVNTSKNGYASELVESLIERGAVLPASVNKTNAPIATFQEKLNHIQSLTPNVRQKAFHELLEHASMIPVDALYKINPPTTETSFLYLLMILLRSPEEIHAFLKWFDAKGLDSNRPVMVNNQSRQLLHAIGQSMNHSLIALIDPLLERGANPNLPKDNVSALQHLCFAFLRAHPPSNAQSTDEAPFLGAIIDRLFLYNFETKQTTDPSIAFLLMDIMDAWIVSWKVILNAKEPKKIDNDTHTRADHLLRLCLRYLPAIDQITFPRREGRYDNRSTLLKNMYDRVMGLEPSICIQQLENQNITYAPMLIDFLTMCLEEKVTIDMNKKPDSLGQTPPSTRMGKLMVLASIYQDISSDLLIRVYDTWKPNIHTAIAYDHGTVLRHMLRLVTSSKEPMYDQFAPFLIHIITKDPFLAFYPLSTYYPESRENILLKMAMAHRVDFLHRVKGLFTPEQLNTPVYPNGPNMIGHLIEVMLIENIQPTEQLTHSIQLLFDIGCTANTTVPIKVGQINLTIFYPLTGLLLYYNSRRTDLYDAYFRLFLHHPSTNLDYVLEDRSFPLLYTAIDQQEYELADEIILLGASVTKSFMRGSLRPLYHMFHHPDHSVHYMPLYEQWISPGGLLYRSTAGEDAAALTDMMEIFFSDPSVHPFMVKPNSSNATKQKFAMMTKHMVNVHVACWPADKIAHFYALHMEALPRGDDYYYIEGPLFHPHGHPVITPTLETTGGVTAKGLMMQLTQTDKMLRMTDDEKRNGVECYLGDECPAANKMISLTELSVMLPPAFWEVWKPNIDLKGPIVLRGLKHTVGEHAYNAVVTNFRAEDSVYGRIYEHTVCPFCAETVFRNDGCSYMMHGKEAKDHTIPTAPFCRKDLCVPEVYEPFYQAATNFRRAYAQQHQLQFHPMLVHVEFCVDCGAPCVNHQHVEIQADGTLKGLPIPKKHDASGREVDDYGVCPGGGRRELIARCLGAMDRYATLPREKRIPKEERREVLMASQKAAHDPNFLAMAAEYLDMMGPYESIAAPLRMAEQELETIIGKKNQAKNNAEAAALQARIEELRARIKDMQAELEALSKTMQLKIDLPALSNVTYNNDDYRRWEQSRAVKENAEERSKKLSAFAAAISGSSNTAANAANAANNRGPVANNRGPVANNRGPAAENNGGNEKENQGGGRRHRTRTRRQRMRR